MLSCGMMLGGKVRPAAPLYVLGQCPHGCLGNFDAFATIDRGFCNINGGEDFRTTAFAVLASGSRTKTAALMLKPKP